MKPLLATILLCLSLTVFGQVDGDNVITIKGVSFDKIVNALLDSGYVVSKIDKDFHTVLTKYNITPLIKNRKRFYYLAFDIRVKDDSVAIIKAIVMDSFGFESNLVRYTIKFQMVTSESWERMNDFALSFNKPVEYSKIQ